MLSSNKTTSCLKKYEMVLEWHTKRNLHLELEPLFTKITRYYSSLIRYWQRGRTILSEGKALCNRTKQLGLFNFLLLSITNENKALHSILFNEIQILATKEVLDKNIIFQFSLMRFVLVSPCWSFNNDLSILFNEILLLG